MTDHGDYRSILQTLIEDNLGDIIGVVLVNSDGLLIDSYITSDTNPDHAAMISSTLLNFVNRTNNSLNLGKTSEILLKSDQGWILLMPVSDSMLMVTMLNSTANLGLVRFALQATSQQLLQIQ